MTRIPVPEARRSSPSVSRRKRHVAGSESVKKNEMTDILDPNVKSKPVLPSGGAGNKKSLFFESKTKIHYIIDARHSFMLKLKRTYNLDG